MPLKNQFKEIKVKEDEVDFEVEKAEERMATEKLLNKNDIKRINESELITSGEFRAKKDLHNHNGINSEKVSIKDLLSFVETVTVIPTNKPRYFYEQFKIYVDDIDSPTVKRLYVYSNKTQEWNFIDLSGGVKLRAYRSGTYTVPDTTQEIIEFNAETYDTGSNFNTITHKFTAPNTGYYDVSITVLLASAAAGDLIDLYIYKNTTKMAYRGTYAQGANTSSFHIRDTVYCEEGDTLEGQIEHDAGAARNLIGIESSSYITINQI